MCATVGLADLPDDPSLIDQAALAQGGFLVAQDAARIQSLLETAFASRNAVELEAQLAALDVPCAKLRQLSEVLREAADGSLMTLPLRKTSYAGGTLIDFGAGYKADHDSGTALAAAPRLGQHTGVLLASLGVGGDELAALTAAGTIRC